MMATVVDILIEASVDNGHQLIKAKLKVPEIADEGAKPKESTNNFYSQCIY